MKIGGFERIGAFGVNRYDIRIAGEGGRRSEGQPLGGPSTETGPTVPLAKAPAPIASEFRPLYESMVTLSRENSTPLTTVFVTGPVSNLMVAAD